MGKSFLSHMQYTLLVVFMASYRRSYVFTLGFHEDYIERRLHQTSAKPDDVVVLFTGKPAIGGVKRAFESLRARSLSIGLPEPKLIELEYEEPSKALYQAKQVINALPEPIIADLSGGMRVIVIIVYTALLLEGKHFELYMQPEGSMHMHLHIPRGIIHCIRNPLSKEKMEILKIIMENPGITVKELAQTVGRKEKTIINHMIELKKLNLVVQKGKLAGLYPTQWTPTIIPETKKIPTNKTKTKK